jgi:tRNA pseudouridine38-40 synthase
MYNLKLVIQFDGSVFYGFQRLTVPNKPTVQALFEQKLSFLLGHPVGLHGSGRTDRGVHSLESRISFRVENDSIPPDGVVRMLKGVLPGSVRILSWEVVDENYHPLRGIKVKSYSYYLIFGRQIKPFYRNYLWNVLNDLDVDLMQEASSIFVGEHDFASFANGSYPIERRVKRIFRIKIKKIPHVSSGLVVRVSGSGFLHRMVRRIVGALIDVGRKKLTKEELQKILADESLRSTYTIAPASGLYLARIKY